MFECPICYCETDCATEAQVFQCHQCSHRICVSCFLILIETTSNKLHGIRCPFCRITWRLHCIHCENYHALVSSSEICHYCEKCDHCYDDMLALMLMSNFFYLL